eukprot:6114864-Pyramimonas_sp.AAC.1
MWHPVGACGRECAGAAFYPHVCVHTAEGDSWLLDRVDASICARISSDAAIADYIVDSYYVRDFDNTDYANVVCDWFFLPLVAASRR